MSDTTPRLALPFLSAGQAQKELAHNEALALIDMAVQPVVLGIAVNDPPPAPSVGQCWISGATPTGDWAGHPAALAAWTSGGWRFIAPFEGLAVRTIDGLPAAFQDGAWSVGLVRAASVQISGKQVVGPRQPAIAAPSGGTVVDGEARSAIGAILAALATHGLLDP